ncbi:MAG: hypothetical protein C3F12_02650 [Candidatus Methylomirabilota bacterium]|nr:MAG: hypothetical protein C3F12_02650 [candidate division NC10 bacterium]
MPAQRHDELIPKRRTWHGIQTTSGTGWRGLVWAARKRMLGSQDTVNLVFDPRMAPQSLKDLGMDGMQVLQKALAIERQSQGMLIKNPVAQPIFCLPVDAGILK